MLARRIASAASLIGVTLLFIVADAFELGGAPAGLWMLPIYLFLVCGTAYEFASLLRSQADLAPTKCTGVVAAGAVIGAVPVYYPLIAGRRYPTDCPIGIVGWATIAVAAAIGLLLIDAIRSYARTRQSIVAQLAAGTLVAAYCLSFAHFLICLRLSPPDRDGLLLLIGVVAVTKMSDTGAYFLGRSFGRTPLHRVISPKKTIEGAIGGILAAVITAVLYYQIFFPAVSGGEAKELTLFRGLALTLSGAAIAVVALIGDLSESLIKRSCNAKDSSGLLPGLGGVWDVTDSLFFVAPLAYLCAVAGWIG